MAVAGPSLAVASLFLVARTTSTSGEADMVGQVSVFHLCTNGANWAVYIGAGLLSDGASNTGANVFLHNWQSGAGAINPTLCVNSSATPKLGGETASASTNLGTFNLGRSSNAAAYFTGQLVELALFSVQQNTTNIGTLFSYAGARYNQSWS
jgi:hypothetical protein